MPPAGARAPACLPRLRPHRGAWGSRSSGTQAVSSVLCLRSARRPVSPPECREGARDAHTLPHLVQRLTLAGRGCSSPPPRGAVWPPAPVPRLLREAGRPGGQGGTHPPAEPAFLPRCVRGSLEASFSSSVHSRSHSSSVYTSPDCAEGRLRAPAWPSAPARGHPLSPFATDRFFRNPDL